MLIPSVEKRKRKGKRKKEKIEKNSSSSQSIGKRIIFLPSVSQKGLFPLHGTET